MKNEGREIKIVKRDIYMCYVRTYVRTSRFAYVKLHGNFKENSFSKQNFAL